ncbi:MAG: hypothetical protein J7K83_03425 [Candidatus Aenigmarchaeota archaeon]|nr:hypothetical protein [Candidatus Aenigmarchaeota archaeon]
MVLQPNELIFSIVVPFLIYYVLLFGILERIRLFNKRTNSLLSLLIGILGTYSLYKIGLSGILPSLAAIFIVSIFGAIFFFGAGKKSLEYANKAVSQQNSRDKDNLKLEILSICSKILNAMQEGDTNKVTELKQEFLSKMNYLRTIVSQQEYEEFKKSLPQECQTLI